MNTREIKKIAVIGAGSMGHQIAMLCAIGGFETYLQDIDENSLSRARHELEGHMDRWVRKGKLDEEKKAAAFSKLNMTTDLTATVYEADFVIEAVVEKLEIKQELFRKLDELAPDHTVLATNSSTIVSSKLAAVTSRPEQILNMHFFYPPLVMDLIEVVKNDKTSEETVEIAMQVCEQIRRTGVLLEKEIYGFIANRLLFALSNEAMYLYENGYADFEVIDTIARKALGHPLGPFEIADLSGIDVGYYTNLHLYEETGDPKDKPPKAVEEKVKAGHLGRKTGKGWYDYTKEGVK